MRVLFAGSPAIAVPSLETLVLEEGKIEIAGVLTNPDSPKGRHGTPVPTEIGEVSDKINRQLLEKGSMFPVLKPDKLDANLRQQVKQLNPDLLVSFAYGRLFGPKFLDLFPLGGINIHPSLLPKYRGPTPVQAAILNRDTVTGISIQILAAQMDAGDILAVEHLQLTGRETTASLSKTVSEKAALMLPVVLDDIKKGKSCRKQQEQDKASYCSLITKEEGFINWNKSALEIEAKIRAFDPWPLCRTIHNGRELFILKADLAGNRGQADKGRAGQVLGIDKQDGILVQTGEGILAVKELQYQSKKALYWRDFLNGARDFLDSILQ